MPGKISALNQRLWIIGWLLIAVLLLAGCIRFNPSLFVDEPYSYKASPPDKDGTFDFDQYMAFAWEIVSAWDPQAKLEGVSRLVRCDAVELDKDLSMLFRFYRPRLYWFGQRIEWLEVYKAADENSYANVRVFTSLNTRWDKPPIEQSALAIDYSTALEMAREKGGALYGATHHTCYLRVVLVENQWNFEYMEDESGVSNDTIRLCVDGVTGEPCEYFYDYDEESDAQSAVKTPLESTSESTEYACQRRAFAIDLEDEFAAQFARVQMADDNIVEVEMWVYRPQRFALENSLPTPTPIPDRFAPEHLPTDYERGLYNLLTGEFKLVEQAASPLRNSVCDACEQQVLSQSPDGDWQLLAITQAEQAYFNGIWLLHRGYFQRLVAPFDDDSYYRPSETWWRWQSDSSGLYLSYWTAGERAAVPMYIELSLPPAYRFLLEGVHLGAGMFNNRSTAVDDSTILLDVSGPIVRNDGSSSARQWYVFDIPSGNLRQATPTDFGKLVKYLLVDATEPELMRWGNHRQQQWLADHPGEDIWNQLGESALFTEPYRTAKGVVRIPLLTDRRESLQLIDCALELRTK